VGLIHYTFNSRVLRENTHLDVVLPTFARRGDLNEMERYYEPGRKFRVLYVLHGGSDDCTFYIRNTGIERYAQDGGFAAVFPEVRNSFYSDMKFGQRYLTYLTEELPALVESLFPISSRREDHFVVGNSMGSHGTLKWAVNCPDYFAAAAGMSGMGCAQDMGFFNGGLGIGGLGNPIENAFGTLEDYLGSRNDVKLLAKKLVDSGAYIPRLFSCCGTEDPYKGGALKFHEYADEIGMPLTWMTGPGAHTWEFWDHWLPIIIKWMGISPIPAEGGSAQ
jgi:putative tributyrin esterase